MNIFMSIVWVILTLSCILLIQIYTQYSYQSQQFYSKALPQTKCITIDNSQSAKLCVHCLNTKNIKNDHISTSNFQITSTITGDNGINLPYKTFALKTLNVAKQNDLFCQEYLQFVDVEKFVKQRQNSQMVFENGEGVKKMVRLIQAELHNITDVDRKSGNQIFQLSSQNAQKQVIYEILSHPSSRNPQLVAKYFSRTSLNIVLNFTLNISLLLFLVACCVTYFIDSQKSQKIPNYTSIVLSSILMYVFLYLQIKLGLDSIFFQSLSWAVFTWICITKLDNIDDDQYKSSFFTKVILSYLSGFSVNLTQSTGSNLYLGGFYLLFSIYLLFFRIIARSKANSPFKVQIINTLVYICLTLTFLIQSLVVGHLYSFRFIKQIQIFRYGILFFTPIIMVLIIYSENQIKVQNFQEYMEVQGSHMSMEENQLQEMNK